jgi:hypothetical protein
LATAIVQVNFGDHRTEGRPGNRLYHRSHQVTSRFRPYTLSLCHIRRRYDRRQTEEAPGKLDRSGWLTVAERVAGRFLSMPTLTYKGLKSVAAAIRTFHGDMHSAALPGYVVHPGDIHLPLGAGVTALPFADL